VFAELPKLFDRDFAIGYFLPAALFIALSYFVIAWFGFHPVVVALSADSFLKESAGFGLLSLLGGIILLVLNRGIVRFLEGYWPLRDWLNWIELRRFRKLREDSRLSDEQKQHYKEINQEFPRALQDKRNKIKLKEATRFPNEERLILPTSFGNSFRAFEVYPRVMYGINAIPAWYRLLAVVPKEYRALIDSARVSLDFWVNLCFLSLVLIVEYFSLAVWTRQISLRSPFSLIGPFPLLPFLFLSSAWVSYVLGKKATVEWGNWVKSAFDIYLPKLRAALEFATPDTKGAERKMWIAFNRAVLARDPQLMPEKNHNQPEPTTIEELEAQNTDVKLGVQGAGPKLETIQRRRKNDMSAMSDVEPNRPSSQASNGPTPPNTRLKDLIALKDYAVYRGLEVPDSLLKEINEIQEVIESPEPGSEQSASNMRLDAAIRDLTLITLPTTIDSVRAADDENQQRYTRYFKIYLPVLAIVAVTVAIYGYSHEPPTRYTLSLLATSLGLLGAIVFHLFSMIGVLREKVFVVEDMYVHLIRIVLGPIVGWVIFFGFCQSALKFQDGKISIDSGNKNALLLLLVPFLAGFSTKLFFGFINQAIRSFELILGIEDKRNEILKRQRHQ
jgi:hypothetical protein